MQRHCSKKEFDVIKKLNVKRSCNGNLLIRINNPSVRINNTKSQQFNLINVCSLLQVFQLQVVIRTYRLFPLSVFVISEFSSKEQVDHIRKVSL